MHHLFCIALVLTACDDASKAGLGEACHRDVRCASNVCIDQTCVAADGDYDDDGIPNGDEVARGLDPSLADTDRDGVRDELEWGNDSDGDGLDDAREDALGDRDADCLVDQLDPDNDAFDEGACTRDHTILAVAFIPNLDVGACVDDFVELSQASLDVRGGAFTAAWMDTLTVTGVVEGETLDATLSCVGHVGGFEATRRGTHYEGRFDFGGKAGFVFVAVNDPGIGAAWYGVVLGDDAGEQVRVAGASIRVALDAEATTTSSSDGLFYLETAIDPDRHVGEVTMLRVEAPGYQPRDIEVPVGFGFTSVYALLTPIAR